MLINKITKTLLFAGSVLCLLQIWWPAYYLTGDGPCHVYNAQILHDLWCHKNTLFYNRFYEVNTQPNPNWLSTIVIALLLFIVKGAIAEKIFLTFYIAIYISGGWLLLRKISGKSSYWKFVVFIFIFTMPLAKGFYNFSFSIAFYFWMIWSWLSILERRNIGNGLLFFFFSFLTFFTHLLPFVFGTITCTALLISYSIATRQEQNETRIKNFFFKNGLLLALLLAPFVILMGWFTGSQGGMQIHIGHHFYRLIELVRFKYIVTLDHNEVLFCMLAGFTLSLLFCILLFYSVRSSLKINKYDGFVLALLFVTFVYLFFPEEFLGRLILISMRTQLFVWILVVCVISYRVPSEKIRNTFGLILFGYFIALSIVRLSCQVIASRAVADIMSSAKYIKPNSVVLPLNFNLNGLDEKSRQVFDQNWPFRHAYQYMGTEKPLIILDNYEANTGYFPLLWNENINPYRLLGKEAGIEGMPPFVKIKEYKQTSGVTIDHILMWCYDPSFLSDRNFNILYKEINESYHIIYATPGSRTILYEKNANIQ